MRRIRIQTRAELMLIIRNGEQLLLTIFIPIILLVFFGNVEALPILGDDRLGFIVPGVLAVAIMSTSMVSLGIATGFERSYLVLKRLGATPLTRGELVTAKILSIFAIEVLQLFVLIPVGLLCGWTWGGARGLLAIPVVLLGTSAFAGIGLILSGRLKAEINLAAQNGLYLLLLLLGGMIIPVDSLPGVVGTVTQWLPSTAMSDLLRTTLNNSSAGLATPTLTLICWALVTPLIAARRFRWS